MMTKEELFRDICSAPFVKNNKRIAYSTAIIAFDIETTSTFIEGQKVGIPYAFCVGVRSGAYRGRSIEQFVDLLKELSERMRLSCNKRLIVWVHNLAFEFQHIRRYLEWSDVFSVGERKVARALTVSGIEFRCTYLMTNLSLARVSEFERLSVNKLVGDLDYSLVRTPSTELTQTEWEYIEHDVGVVVELIKKKRERKNICDIPMTATGFVRRDVRERCFDSRIFAAYIADIHQSNLTEKAYRALRRAFFGGFVHANRNHLGETLENVASFDITSDYPFQMLRHRFPRGECVITSYDPSADYRDKRVIYDIEYTSVRKKPHGNACVLSSSKCQYVNGVCDNGRIKSADLIRVTMTDIDMTFFDKFYDYAERRIKRVYVWDAAPLPRAFRRAIISYYQKKTTLKGVKGREEEYARGKSNLNSLYGMVCTDVVRDKNVYKDGEWSCESPDVSESLTRYNNSKGRFTFYAWGVWVTAFARSTLYEAILALGDDFVYSDTDSVKFLNFEKHKGYFEAANVTCRENLLKNYATDEVCPCDIKGRERCLGTWDFEGIYSRFKTLGSKRYLTEMDGVLSMTVSGLSKKTALEFLEHSEQDVFKAFAEGLYVPGFATGKLTHTYVDFPVEGEVVDYQGNTAHVRVPSSIHLSEADYLMSVSPYTD